MDTRLRSARIRRGLLSAGAGGLLVAGLMAASPAFASNTTTNVNETMWHVGLNPGSPDGGCQFNPTTLGSTAKQGQAVFHVSANTGTTVLDVSISGAVPSTAYDVDIRCQHKIGTINTDPYGNGSTEIVLSSSDATYVSTNYFFVDAAINPGTSPCPCSGEGNYGDTFISTEFSPLGS